MRGVILFFLLLFTACSNKFFSSTGNYKRVALVIGNQNYKLKGDRLRNPINDSVSIGEMLHKVGYKVIYKKDLDKYGLEEALEALRKEIVPNETIVFIYYAGHSIIREKDSKTTHLQLVDNKKVFYSINKILEKLKEFHAKHNILAIDSCQNYKGNYIDNNKQEQHRLRASNFKLIEAEAEKQNVIFYTSKTKDLNQFPSSTLISHATETNYGAAEQSSHDKDHSPYARCLINYIPRDDLTVEYMFIGVRRCVVDDTNGRQMSFKDDNLIETFTVPIIKGSSSIGIGY